MAALNRDVFLMILDCLKDERGNHDTLLQCALVSRWFAEPALSILYKSRYTCPAFDLHPNGASIEELRLSTEFYENWDELTSLRTLSTTALSKWALMWKSIVLSTFPGKSYLPYCNYIWCLNLIDFNFVYRHPEFKGPLLDDLLSHVAYLFDEGCKRDPGLLWPGPQNDPARWLIGVFATILSEKCPMIRELRGDVSDIFLEKCVVHLPKLETLFLQDGDSFGKKADQSIRDHCPNFKNLSVFEWVDRRHSGTADAEAERVLQTLRPNSLKTFEASYALSSLGTRTILSLRYHLQSLSKLVMTNLSPQAVAQLSTLDSPRALATLVLSGSAFVDGEEDPTNVALVSWISRCQSLHHLHLQYFDPALLSRVLKDERIHLQKLILEDQISNNWQLFTDALPFQAASLRVLYLSFKSCPLRPSMESLCQALCKMRELRELNFTGFQDGGCLPHDLETLALHLTKLERLSIVGLAFRRNPWPAFQCLKSLSSLRIFHCSVFERRPPTPITSRLFEDAILDFVKSLGPANKGFQLSTSNRNGRDHISTEMQSTISHLLEDNVGGSFYYNFHSMA